MKTEADNPNSPTLRYGFRDTTYEAAGGEEGIRKLVDSFYDTMMSYPKYRRIYDWHPDGETAREKLARFLCGWMGGPKRYQEKYGPISIPAVHSHLDVTEIERDMWLDCMTDALALQPYPDELKLYLREQLAIPAEHVRKRCMAPAD